MTIVAARDCINTGGCLGGMSRFFEYHNLDFKGFIRNGADVSEFKGIEDGNLERAILAAKAREKAEKDGR